MDALERYRAAEQREAEAELALRKAQLEKFKARRALIFSIVAGDAGVVWTAQRVVEVLSQRGLVEDASEIEQFLEGGVRQQKLLKVSTGYQLLRPAVLKSLTHPLRTRS